VTGFAALNPSYALRAIRNQGRPLAVSPFLREAEGEEIVITRNGKPAGVPIGFASEDDWLDYQLETTGAFCAASNRRATACGKGMASGSRMSSETLKSRALSKLSP
jgi:hypothetical protein